MKTEKHTYVRHTLFFLASAAGLWLLFNLVALPLAWGGVSASGGTLGAIQLLILLGFLLVLVFDLVSLAWVSLRGKAQMGGETAGGLVVLGVLALIAMMGAKVMVDEIARETPLGGAGGEWGVLYACLILQLSYILGVLFRTKPEKS
jgi:hypothetical protein